MYMMYVYTFAGSCLVTPCNKRLYHLECMLTYIPIVSRYRQDLTAPRCLARAGIRICVYAEVYGKHTRCTAERARERGLTLELKSQVAAA